MTEIKLTKRYPHSRTEDITDAFMRGYQQGYKAKEYDRQGDCDNCKFVGIPHRCEGCCRNYADGYIADCKTENSSEKPNNCDDEPQTEIKSSKRLLKGSDEPQTYKPTCNGECRNCEYRAKDGNYCMKTDCAWK